MRMVLPVICMGSPFAKRIDGGKAAAMQIRGSVDRGAVNRVDRDSASAV
jgi:hypothetical protein